MDFKKTIFEACADVPFMGEAIAAAYDCIFEADATTQTPSTQVQNGGTTANDVAIDPAAITENPDAAKVLANVAAKAAQEQKQVEQAQQQLDQSQKQLAQTTEATKEALANLNKEHDAKETLGETNQQQIPSTQG